MSNLTYYDVLHVPVTVEDAGLRAAYIKMAKQHHPDSNPYDRHLASARFRLIQEAYDVLRDPIRRRDYDLNLRNQKWLGASPYNDNAGADTGDVISSARRTIERLMRIMSATRDVGVETPTNKENKNG